MPLTIPFLTDEQNQLLDSATHLRDPDVRGILGCVAKQAAEESLTGHHLNDACMSGAALLYTKAAETLRVIQDAHGPNAGEYIKIAMARIAVADSLTHRAGKNWEISKAFGHLTGLLDDDPDTREAFAANTLHAVPDTAAPRQRRSMLFEDEPTGAVE